MTDEELIARLREIQGQAGLFAAAGADRIAALRQAVQHANDHADAAIKNRKTLVKSRDEYRLVARVLDDCMVAAEARAERLEAALLFYAASNNDHGIIARAALKGAAE